MATNHTRQPLTDEARLAEIYRQVSDGLHDWITRHDHPTEPDHDDPTIVLAPVSDDELVDFLVLLISLSRTAGSVASRKRYQDFIAVVADEAKLRMAAATDTGGF